jgi:hypothetical protein
MLVCDDENARVEAAKKYLNYSLGKGVLVIYASVNVQQSFYQSKLFRMISNCDEHIATGNLLIFELGAFFESASLGDMEPFEDLKVVLEEIIKERIVAGRNGEVMIFGDCADFLSRCEMFEQCVALEQWWDEACKNWLQNEMRISVVCPHSTASFARQNGMQFKEEMSELHSVILQAPIRWPADANQ